MSMVALDNCTPVKATPFSLLNDNIMPLDESPLVLPRHDVGSLDQAIQMLDEADRVIQAQEQRIRLLENLALTDELTGLLNRRAFMQVLNRELAASRRRKGDAGLLVLIDLDGFKRVNDIWGHTVGDTYLQAVAKVLLNEVRPSDVVARLGGDEFAILLTKTPCKPGVARVEKIEKVFNARVMHWRECVLPLCASFGSVAYGAGKTSEEIIAAADLQLYLQKAKNKG